MITVRGKQIEPLYSVEEIAKPHRAEAGEIAAVPAKDLLVISVLKGSFVFAADLIRALHHAGRTP